MPECHLHRVTIIASCHSASHKDIVAREKHNTRNPSRIANSEWSEWPLSLSSIIMAKSVQLRTSRRNEKFIAIMSEFISCPIKISGKYRAFIVRPIGAIRFGGGFGHVRKGLMAFQMLTFFPIACCFVHE